MQTATPLLADPASPEPSASSPQAPTTRRPMPQDKEAAFRKLWNEYGTSLHYFLFKRVGHHDDAAELTQQAFVEAACALSSWRGESELSTWLFGIAANLARNHMSRSPQRRHHFVSEAVLEDQESPFSNPLDQASQAQALTLADEAMAKLPPDMAAALSLVAIEGLSYEETAQRLNVPVGTVRSRVSRARAAVREHFHARGAHSLD
jgi:RNA polymerase sigma-70 factor (ECF subfamily)